MDQNSNYICNNDSSNGTRKLASPAFLQLHCFPVNGCCSPPLHPPASLSPRSPTLSNRMPVASISLSSLAGLWLVPVTVSETGLNVTNASEEKKMIFTDALMLVSY